MKAQQPGFTSTITWYVSNNQQTVGKQHCYAYVGGIYKMSNSL